MQLMPIYFLLYYVNDIIIFILIMSIINKILDQDIVYIYNIIIYIYTYLYIV